MIPPQQEPPYHAFHHGRVDRGDREASQTGSYPVTSGKYLCQFVLAGGHCKTMQHAGGLIKEAMVHRAGLAYWVQPEYRKRTRIDPNIPGPIAEQHLQPQLIVHYIVQHLLNTADGLDKVHAKKGGLLVNVWTNEVSIRVPGVILRQRSLRSIRCALDTNSSEHGHVRVIGERFTHSMERTRQQQVVAVQPAKDPACGMFQALVYGMALPPVLLATPPSQVPCVSLYDLT